MNPLRYACGVALVVAGAACASRPTPPTEPRPGPAAIPVADSARSSPRLPAVPPVHGKLSLRVIYPGPDAAIQLRDSSFLFGSAGTGDARLWINGQPVRVWPNGAWLAWLPFPVDSLMRFQIEARTPTDSASLSYSVRRAGVAPPCSATRPCAGQGAVWIDSTSLAPQGKVWWPRAEYLSLSARASEGALVRLRLADGTIVPLTAQPAGREVPAIVRALDRDTNNLQVPVPQVRYLGVIRGRAVGPDPGPVVSTRAAVPLAAIEQTLIRCIGARLCGGFSRPADTAWAWAEAIRGDDTVRVHWPLRLAPLDTLPTLAQFDDDTLGLGDTDSITVARALPGGTYHWFFPTGTRISVLGRVNSDLRVRLSRDTEAWVSAADARAIEGTTPMPLGVVGSVSLTPEADRAVLRIPLSQRIPFRVTETERSLALRFYSAVGDVDWIRYGSRDSLVRRMSWAQNTADEITLRVDLSQPVWGYRTRWLGGNLLLEIRRQPAIDPSNPLRGRLIGVDPGHPPAGANGPTGLREAEANLAVALELRRLLEQAGARVLMTRTTDTDIDLWPRVKLADSANADLLVSIHNNALPDGLNPFTSSGTSVFYNHPRSVPLARDVQAALVARLGLRDLGIGRGDLALVRGTWMPSILTEGLFMILPDQEAALRTRQGQELYAQGVFEGIRRFLRDRASPE
jgi:N-acetylmuramoyl-L-alanine amidase